MKTKVPRGAFYSFSFRLKLLGCIQISTRARICTQWAWQLALSGNIFMLTKRETLWTKTNCSSRLFLAPHLLALAWVGAETEFWRNTLFFVSSAAIIKSRRVPDALALNGFRRRSDGVALPKQCSDNLAQKWGVNYDFGAIWNAFAWLTESVSAADYSSLRFRGNAFVLHTLQNGLTNELIACI